jgi:sulfopyruvate decarboxylase subunit beta
MALKKDEAIKLVLERFPFSYVVSTCGHISRDLYNIRDRSEHFYMVGSMGMAAPIALGLAITKSDHQIVILDGDGSFLMNLGVISMIGQQQPKNIIHVVLDNGMHESTGGQRTVVMADIAEVAVKMGYRFGVRITTREEWLEPLPEVGPVLIHMKVEPRSERIGKRVEWTPSEIVSRFSAVFES